MKKNDLKWNHKVMRMSVLAWLMMMICGVTMLTHAAFTINLGADVKSGSTYQFPALTVSGLPTDRGYQVRIMFTRAVTASDAITLPTVPGTTLPAGSTAGGDKNVRVVNIGTGGATAAQLQAFLRLVTINVDPTKQGHGIMILISESSADNGRNFYYSSDTKHWYELVQSNSITWANAYNAAASRTFMLKDGYLATVTSKEEDDLLSSLINQNKWMAGTRWDISSIYDPVTRKLTSTANPPSSALLGYWYWAAGPEWEGNGRNPSQSVFYDMVTYNQGSPTPGITVRYTWANWSNNEPNNSSTEYCTHFLAAGKWNDFYNYNTGVNYYLVEYDDITAGTSGLVGFNSTKSATVNGTAANGTSGSPATLVIGETLKYTITAGNASDINSIVTVRDTVPEGLTVGAISNAGVYNSSTREILWTLSVTPQGTQAITYEATKTSDSTSWLMVNTAYVTSNSGTLVKQTNSTYHDAKACTITFVAGANGSVSGGPQYVEYGENPYAGVNYTPNPGYEFDGWSYPAYTPFKGASQPAKSGITNYTAETVLGDVVFTAHSKIINYNLTYNLDGGTPTSPNPTTYNVTQLPLAINNLTRTGYTFLGWTELPATTPATNFTIPTTTILDHKTLTAHWDTITYTIEYKNAADGGTIPVSFSSANPTAYNVETPTITVVNPTRSGYTFIGWTDTLNSQLTLDMAKTIPAGSINNRELYANWTRNTYTITYNLNSGTAPGTSNPATYTIEDTYPSLTFSNLPTRLGYTFTGWTGDNGTNPQTSVTIPQGTTGNLTYEANWSRDTYSITYVPHGGTLSPLNPATYNVETPTITLVDPTRLGYTFAGWTDTLRGITPPQPISIATGSTGNRVLYANWNIVTYSMTYNLDGGTAPGTPNPASYTIEDTPVNFSNQPTKSGYTFLGWTGANGTTPQRNVEVVLGTTGNLSYTANWSEDDYVISYNYNGGQAPAISNKAGYKVTDAPFVILNQPTRAGYTFAGWTGSNGATPAISITITAGTTGDLSYTANWTSIGYNITYNGDGGTTPAGNPAAYNVTTATITLDASVRPGYTFGGWAITSDSLAVTVPTGVTIPTGTYGNLTCVAQWTIDTYNITYNYNGGNPPLGNPSTYDVTDLAITLNPSSRTGYDFNGWTITSDTAAAPLIPDGSTIPTGTYGNLTCVAKWIKLYSVTYNRGLGTSGIEPSDATWYNWNDPVTVKGNEGSPRMTLTDACFIGWSFNPPAAVITVVTAIPADRKEPPADWFNILADTTLYAIWAVDKTGPGGVPDSVPDFDQFKVLYDGNTHTGGYIPVDINNYNGGDMVTRKGNTGFLTKTNATFIGWSETASPLVITLASEPADLSQGGSSFTITADKLFYAVWAEDKSGPNGVPDGIPDYKQYAVTYVGNGNTSGVVPVDINLYNSGNMVRILRNTGVLARTNTCFIGWSNTSYGIITTEPAIPSDLVQGGQTFAITAGKIFYAVWAEDTNGPDGVPDSIPDFRQMTLTYHENSAYPSVGGALPALTPLMYVKNTPVTIKGNTGNLAGNPATSLVFAGWSRTDGCTPVIKAKDKPADFLMGGDVISAGTTNIDLYVVWAEDSNGNGIPDYNEPNLSVDPLHQWPKTEDQGDPSAPGYYPLKPDWNPAYDAVAANTMYADCDMCFVITIDPDPYRDRVFTLNYLGALRKEMVIDVDGNPLADSYTIPKGAANYTVKFSLMNVDQEIEGLRGALEAVIAGGGRDTSAWVTMYNHPTYNSTLVTQYVDINGRINLGITGGSPYLMVSINGLPWRNAYLPLTDMEMISVDDGVSIWLREPNGCWETQMHFRTYSEAGIHRSIEIIATPGVTTEPGAGIYYVRSRENFTFTASYADGKPLKVLATGFYSNISEELIGSKVENDTYEYVIRQVLEPWTVTFGPELSSYDITGTDPVDKLLVWSYNNTLNLRSGIDRTVYVYHITGTLYKRIDVKAGYDYREIMEPGIYVVITGHNQYKVIIK